MKLDKENGGVNKKGLLKGMGMMGACCLLPIIIIAILPLISSSLGMRGTRIASLIGALICPVMMIGMMVMMGKGKGCCSKKDEDELDK